MRGVVVAELVLLAVGLLLAAALLLQCCLGRGTTTHKRRPQGPSSSSELPLSRGDPATDKQSRLLLLLMLCSGRRRRARVEPAAPANSAEASPAAAAEAEDVARWRERWFGPASRALYTIDEVDEECPTEDGDITRDQEKPEPETPFYTPPGSPLRLAGQSPPAA